MEKDAFVREAEGLWPGLYRIAGGMLKSAADAEDAVQQTMLKAWERHREIREDTFRPYLSRILVNQCRDMLRQRRRVMPSDALPDQPYAEPRYEGPDPALVRALQSLKEELRLPLLLHCMEGYSIRECAAILHIPETMTKNRIYRAKRTLMKAIIELREAEQA